MSQTLFSEHDLLDRVRSLISAPPKESLFQQLNNSEDEFLDLSKKQVIAACLHFLLCIPTIEAIINAEHLSYFTGRAKLSVKEQPRVVRLETLLNCICFMQGGCNSIRNENININERVWFLNKNLPTLQPSNYNVIDSDLFTTMMIFLDDVQGNAAWGKKNIYYKNEIPPQRYGGVDASNVPSYFVVFISKSSQDQETTTNGYLDTVEVPISNGTVQFACEAVILKSGDTGYACAQRHPSSNDSSTWLYYCNDGVKVKSYEEIVRTVAESGAIALYIRESS